MADNTVAHIVESVEHGFKMYGEIFKHICRVCGHGLKEGAVHAQGLLGGRNDQRRKIIRPLTLRFHQIQQGKAILLFHK